MSVNSCTKFSGLQGNNPFEFIAALGIQVAFEFEDLKPRLWWTDEVIPRPCIDKEFTLERVSKQVMKRLSQLRQSPGLVPSRKSGEEIEGGKKLKMSQEDVRLFLDQAREDKFAGRFYMSLLAEGSVDGNGNSKPTDLYFLAGQQKFLHIVKEVISQVEEDEITEALISGERKELKQPTLKLDSYDDPVYALTASNPSNSKKWVNRGIEALAILGLSRFPVFGSRGRTLTQGCSGRWSDLRFDWPIWRRPATFDSVRSILAIATPYAETRHQIYESLSIFKIYRSSVKRGGQDRYGTFRPTATAWEIHGTKRDEEFKSGKLVEVLDELANEVQKSGLTAEDFDLTTNTESGN